MSPLDRALDDCLARAASGENTLAECLQSYPEHAAELRRLLEAAAALELGRAIHPAPTFKLQTKARLAAHMRAHPRRRQFRIPAFHLPASLRWAAALAAFALIFLAAGTTQAQAALPGEPLYRWKLASEQAWRALQADPLAADLALADRRAHELLFVRGDQQAEALAVDEYQQALAALSVYDDPASQALIQGRLARQAEEFRQAGLTLPELELLPTAAPTATQATETATPLPTATATASPVPPTPTTVKTERAVVPAITVTILPTTQAILPTTEAVLPTIEVVLPATEIAATPAALPTDVLPALPTELAPALPTDVAPSLPEPSLPIEAPSLPQEPPPVVPDVESPLTKVPSLLP